MKILPALALLSAVAFALPARAEDELIDMTYSDALAVAGTQGALSGINVHLWGQGARPAIEGNGREVTVSRRTRSHGDSVKDCGWVMAAALKELAMEARKDGADLIVDVRSNWKHNVGMTPGHYQCAVGGFVVGVAVKATVGKSAGAAAKSRAAGGASPELAPQADSMVARGTDGFGHATFEVVVGNRLVGVKLVANPDATPNQVRLALGLSADPSALNAKPHETCGVQVEAGGTKTALPAPRYQRSSDQETLYTDLTLDQLRQLATSDGAFSVCDTRINVKAASREYLKALVDAVDDHVANKPRAVKPGEGLSL
jgi:hypothetical protein